MTGPEFVREHGSPLGDDAHDKPWTPTDFEVWDHLNAADCDEQRLKRARERQLAAAPDTSGGNR